MSTDVPFSPMAERMEADKDVKKLMKEIDSYFKT